MDLNNRFLEEAVFAIADGYCSINLTKNLIPGVMHQVVDGVNYDLNKQLGMPENSSFTEIVAQWALTIPEEGRKDFLDVLDRESLLARYRKGERHISFTYWTRTATYEPMLAEDHLAMFEDEKTGDILGVNYVLDRTEQYRLKQYKAQLEQKTQKLEALLEVEKVYHASVPGYAHIQLSMSIGGAMQTLAEPMEAVVCRADRLMYQAKRHKNKVIVEGSEEEQSLVHGAASSREHQKILIVDDSQLNRELLAAILSDDYQIMEAEDGQEGLKILYENQKQIALILLDINMPKLDGFGVLKAMNANHIIEDIPVIMISSDDSEVVIRESYELGASDYVNRPFDARIVYRRVANTIKLYEKQRRLVQLVSRQIRKQEHNTSMLVGVLSQIVEFRNGESGSHVRNIRRITELLLNHLTTITDKYKLTPEEKEYIPLASALHDIGKIAVDEKILNKPGRLTKEEFEIMKTHSMMGAEMLQKLENFEKEPLLQTAYEIARWHHERWDGSGYPDGLKEDKIPISAQLVSMADVYDALTSERCYKQAFSHETAIAMIKNGECGAFNPLLIQCLTQVEEELKGKSRK